MVLKVGNGEVMKSEGVSPDESSWLGLLTFRVTRYFPLCSLITAETTRRKLSAKQGKIPH